MSTTPSYSPRVILLSIVLIILSIAGIADASYITYNELTGVIPPCHPPFACSTVLNSPWSRIGPIPLSMIGMVFYTIVLVFGLFNYFDLRIIRLPKKVSFYTEDILAALTTFGFGFSLYLIFLMAVILQAWCLYCLVSAFTCMALFVTGFFLRKSILPYRQKPRLAFKRMAFRMLYQYISKPLFFSFDPEFVHERMVRTGAFLGSFGFTRALTSFVFEHADKKLEKIIDGIPFPNPVGLSAGFDYEVQLTNTLPSVGFGWMTVGTITNHAYEGNAKPRLGRYPRSQALLVNKGFKNHGIKDAVRKLRGKQFAIPVGISIGSTNKMFSSQAAQISDIIEAFTIAEKAKLHTNYYELNISCPNTKGGQPFTTATRLEALLSRLDGLHIEKPIYIKMPIDLSEKEILALLDTAKVHTIAGVIFGNLTKDKTNPDVSEHDREQWKTAAGNLSGKPTWNRSNHWIAFTKKHYKNRFTIIGTGGIFTPEDAQTKIDLGADLVQLITGMIYEGPQLIGEINQYLADTRKK